MKISQLQYAGKKWKELPGTPSVNGSSDLVLLFGSRELVSDPNIFQEVKKRFPSANILSSSTSGEILGRSVDDDTVAVTAIAFEKTKIKCVTTQVDQHADSFEAGKFLMQQLKAVDLRAVFVISDGTKINGSELVNGFNSINPEHVPVTGGLAGDAANFQKTATGLNETAKEGNVSAIGFYGDHIKIGHSSLGGWDEFGKERIITKADKNVLYEIDDKNALDLYKEYLGPYADELPGSALLFPLCITVEGSDRKLVRTILSIDEPNKSMTFAGNLPVGSKVRLMKANFDKLIDASSTAASDSRQQIPANYPELAILISCVGRKLILQERTDEEVQAAKDIFGNQTVVTGFYSYGEISPFNPGTNCELHNQTMTITTFTEN